MKINLQALKLITDNKTGLIFLILLLFIISTTFEHGSLSTIINETSKQIK